MLQPIVRRTWAPRGQTPVLRAWHRHERISAVSALTVSPQRRRVGVYFHLQRKNLHWPDLLRFLRQLRRRLPGKIILVLDKWSVHRAAISRLLKQHGATVHVEWLPSYAPELNPVEQVWNNSKYADLANYTPDQIEELATSVRTVFKTKRGNQSLLRSFFRKAQLKL